MSPSERMGTLERRYRRLLPLLPADHRAARGEELLGLLLDLDSGRTRPSLRQALGVFGLALRLRLPDAASLLLSAVLVAYSTEIAAAACQLSVGAATVSVDSRFPLHNVTLALLRLAIPVAWILGARRLTLAVYAALLAYSLATAGGLFAVDPLVFFGLGSAAALRWPTLRPRVVLLAAIPVAMLLWPLSAPWHPDPQPQIQLRLAGGRWSSPHSSPCSARSAAYSPTDTLRWREPPEPTTRPTDIHQRPTGFGPGLPAQPMLSPTHQPPHPPPQQTPMLSTIAAGTRASTTCIVSIYRPDTWSAVR